MGRTAFPAPGRGYRSPEADLAPVRLQRLVHRAGLSLSGTAVLDLTALEPGDVLLFASTRGGAAQIRDYQHVCGHDPADAAFVHAAVFLRDDRIVHARPSVAAWQVSGVRVDSLLTYWTHQEMAVLRHPAPDGATRRDIALAGVAQHGLAYDYSAVQTALNHVFQMVAGA